MECTERTSTQHQLKRKIGRWLATLLSAKLGRRVTYDLDGSWVQYTCGQKYDVHGDAAGLTQGQGRDWTLLLCMQQATCGGATDFPNLGSSFTLRAGDALAWRNFTNDGQDNRAMDHAALPVRSGTKIVINAWFSDA